MALAEIEPGTAVTRQPISTRWRRMFHFMPKSSATTCGRGLKDSLKLGAIAAAEVIQHYGARPEADLKALAGDLLD